MIELNFIYLGLIVIVLVFLYRRHVEKTATQNFNDKYDLIKKYLLEDDKDLSDDQKKPIMWIHIPYEYNARNWLAFGSRSSVEVNQPYLSLTLKSIIKNCDDSFKICIIDDSTFEKLIPNWSINMSLLADPILPHIRRLGMAKLIYNYGGIQVPISFLCFKNLLSLYDTGTQNNKMFICENINQNVTSVHQLFYPDTNFMGANKDNYVLGQYIDFMQRTISNDYTAQIDFLGEFDRWIDKRVVNNKVCLIDGTDVGTKTIGDEPVMVERLMETDSIDFYDNMYGIWIPMDTILKRRHYEWFARMSPEQIFEGNTILCKYFVLALAPDSKNGVIETMENRPDWISFWKTPKVSIWGVKPIYLGNNISRESYPNY